MSEGGERILVADDSRFIRKLLQATLEKESYEVILATNGKETLALATSETPALILLDVQMPEMDGFEVCESLSENDETRDIPIIFLTAQPETEQRIKSLQLPHVDYLAKPFKAAELLARMRIRLRSLQRETVRRVKLAALTQELELAQSIAEKMLPPNQLLLGLDVVGKMVSASHVGGDYYDVFQQGQQAIICIGDVSGKGVPASMVMVMTRTFLHNQEIHDKTPMDILRAVNKMLHAGTEPGVFMSFLLLKWNAETQLLQCCGAGHEHFLIHRAMMQEVETIASGGNVLGLRDEMPGDFFEIEFELEPGDTVLLYTDGVTEAHNRASEMFELGRLESAFERHIIGSTKSLIEGVLDEVLEFVGDAPQHDDITLVALRREQDEEIIL